MFGLGPVHIAAGWVCAHAHCHLAHQVQKIDTLDVYACVHVYGLLRVGVGVGVGVGVRL